MPLYELGNLRTFIERSTDPIPEKIILSFMEQLTSAVQYLHTHNIIHR